MKLTGYQISLIILILLLLLCNLNKLFSNFNNNEEKFNNTDGKHIYYIPNPYCENNYRYCPQKSQGVPSENLLKCKSKSKNNNDMYKQNIEYIELHLDFLNSLGNYLEAHNKNQNPNMNSN